MFRFLQYIYPIWYYRLQEKSPHALFGEAFLNRKCAVGILQRDEGYGSEASMKADLAYQALQGGMIQIDAAHADEKPTGTAESIRDNYRFIRRHFDRKWLLYVVVMRVLTMNNPFREALALWATRKVARIRIIGAQEQVRREVEGAKIREAGSGLVSVIIPTLNRYAYLKDVLDDLERQSYGNIEVIVCDQSDPFEPEIYRDRSIPVSVIRQSEKALWLARNRCIEASKGEYILLFDDDSRVAPDWIENHLKCLAYFNVSISAGITETVVGHGSSRKDGFFHLSDVFDTGNAMVKREVFDRTGLFDRQFERQRMGDGEFGLRAYLAGYHLVSNPLAKRVHLKVDTGGLRQFGSWDAFRPGNLLSPRPVPSVLYLARRYFGDAAAVFLIILSLPPSVIPYRYKKSRWLKALAPIILIPLLPILSIQVARSWKRSGMMMVKGPLIDMPEKSPLKMTIADPPKGVLATEETT